MSHSPCHAIFVYGTLQRGEERERCWPKPPLRVQTATIRGELRDLGEYPGLIDGEDCIAGELWELRSDDMAITLHELDQVECFGQGEVDLYVRKTIECLLADGTTATAFTYYLASVSDARQHPRVLPGPDGICRWHRFRG